MPTPKIAVTGMGCVCGTHTTLPALMKALFAPRAVPIAVKRPNAMHPKGFPLYAVPDDLAEALTIQGGTLSVGMALMASQEALAQAGLTPKDLTFENSGFCLGSSSGASLHLHEYHKNVTRSLPADPAAFTASLTHSPGPALARYLVGNRKDMPHTRGPLVQTVTNACTSGADAIGIAMSWLRQGLCDIVVAGGTDELCLTSITGFSRLLILDSQLCRPFDATRAGLNLGEGAAVLVLERLEHAENRGAVPLAFVSGYGTAADAYHLTAPHPEGRGLKAALNTAMAEAGITPEDVTFINAHGTGTQENDKAEAQVFRSLFPHTLISATKGCTGHTLGAAGAIEAAITISCLNNSMLPASPGFATPHPDLAVSPVYRPTAIDGTYAISQSLAFGGNNSALVFSKAIL